MVTKVLLPEPVTLSAVSCVKPGPVVIRPEIIPVVEAFHRSR